MQSFRLIPYPAEELPGIEIVGEVERIDNRLSIHYSIRGGVENILLPAAAIPLRKDDLWKATCFEFFLAHSGHPEYWEFNMSPSGEWNVYHMNAYRQVNMRDETGISILPFQFQQSDGLWLDLSVDLSPITQPGQSLQIGIAAIIHTKDGKETYWALVHPGKQADFHMRESFVLET